MSFVPRLKSLRPDVVLWGVGGDTLKAQGMELKYHLKDFSSMGFSEVIGKIPFYRNALNSLTAEAKRRNTTDAILVDFQDFNLRLAQRLAKQGVRIWYYVAPQAWAWRAHRAKTLSRTVERLFTILPFEESWFRDRGVTQTAPIPHPLVSNWAGPLSRLPQRTWSTRLKTAPQLMILPGSRRSEVKPLLPIFMDTVRLLKETIPGLQVTLSRVSHLEAGWYDCAKGLVDRWITPEELPEELLRTDVAIAASGTVTLGTGLMGVPTVVAYQSSLLNEYVIRHLIGYDRPVSLTNLVLNERVFPEFLQSQVQAPLLAQAVLNWVQNPAHWEDTRTKLALLPSMMSAGESDVGGLLAREILQ